MNNINKHWIVTFRKDLGCYHNYSTDFGLVGIYDTKEQALAKMNELNTVKNKSYLDEPVTIGYEVLEVDSTKPITLLTFQ